LDRPIRRICVRELRQLRRQRQARSMETHLAQTLPGWRLEPRPRCWKASSYCLERVVGCWSDGVVGTGKPGSELVRWTRRSTATVLGVWGATTAIENVFQLFQLSTATVLRVRVTLERMISIVFEGFPSDLDRVRSQALLAQTWMQRMMRQVSKVIPFDIEQVAVYSGYSPIRVLFLHVIILYHGFEVDLCFYLCDVGYEFLAIKTSVYFRLS